MILFLFFWGSWFGFEQETDCADRLPKVYENYRQKQKGATGLKAIYEVNSVSRDDLKQTEKVVVKINKLTAWVSSSSTELWQDENNLVVVNKTDRMVFITRPRGKLMEEYFIGRITAFQDSLVRHLIPSGCSRICVDQQKQVNLTYANYSVSKPFVEATGLTALDYWFTDDNFIKKIHMTYGEEYPLKDLECNIMEMDFGYSQRPFSGTARAQVLDKNGVLKQIYAGFKLMD
jgi:hypothetical protein